MGEETIAPEIRLGKWSSSANGLSPHSRVRPLGVSVVVCSYSSDRWEGLVRRRPIAAGVEIGDKVKLALPSVDGSLDAAASQSSGEVVVP